MEMRRELEEQQRAAAREEGGSDSVDGGGSGGGHGPWGLGWMKGKKPLWRRHPHDEDEQEQEEEEEEEPGGHGDTNPEVEGGSQTGGSCPSTGDVNTATTEVAPAAADLAQTRERSSDASVEQRLGEALLARAGDRYGREGRSVASWVATSTVEAKKHRQEYFVPSFEVAVIWAASNFD